MADISIDEAKAKIWMDDVRNEINAVEAILKKVNGALTTVAGDDDSIMQGIYKVGTTMESVWTSMCNGFKSAHSILEEALTKLVSSAQNVIDDADTLKNSIGGR